jgi:hypothetical protein
MLVDIHFKPFEPDHIARYREAAEAHNARHPNVEDHIPLEMKHPKRLDLGIYVADSNLRASEIIEHVVEDVPAYRDMNRLRAAGNMNDYFEGERKFRRQMNKLYSEKYKRGPYRDWGGLGAYGLCDSPEQFLATFPHIQDDNIPRFLTFYGIWREHQPEQGGFRYHKHGNYIGKQKPRHEYLYYDTHIDMICGFNVYRVEDLISG